MEGGSTGPASRTFFPLPSLFSPMMEGMTIDMFIERPGAGFLVTEAPFPPFFHADRVPRAGAICCGTLDPEVASFFFPLRAVPVVRRCRCWAGRHLSDSSFFFSPRAGRAGRAF